MSEFPDPDFSFLSTGTGDRSTAVARSLDADGGAVSSGVRDLDSQATGQGLTAGLDKLVTATETTNRAAMAHARSAESTAELRQLAEQWKSTAPKDADIDQADAYAELAQRLMMEAEKSNDWAAASEAEANYRSALQQAQSLRALRQSADEAFNAGTAALAAKINQRVSVIDSDHGGSGVRLPGSLRGAFEEIRSPAPAPAPRTPSAPAAPRTPAGSAPSAPVRPAAASPDKAEMPAMPQVPQQGQQQPQQQGQHPQAGGAMPATTGAKPTDKKREGDSTPTGLAAAVGATGAGASPVSSAATPRATNPGYSVKDLVTGTNVTGRPIPAVGLSAGLPSQAQSTAPGTAAAPGQGGMPYGPGMGGMGNGKGAGREAPRIVQAQQPLEDGVVPGGTILRGDAPPEQKAS
nr:hypothetical protein [Mycobacterium sp. UM_NZ2]